MSTRLFQDKNIQAIDKRIENSHYIENMIVVEGWKLFSARLEELRAEAMYHVLSVDVESPKWRARLHCLDEILGIPEEFITIGKVAKSED